MSDGPRADVADWQCVKVPHSWNAFDGADGGPASIEASYRRGPGWYALSFPSPSLLPGGRAFLQFDAASIVADVYLNGRLLGQHRGAFAAFCFEVTTNLDASARNELRVRVDNSWVADVAPLAGDFTLFGGLYRPVRLLTTSAICFSPLDHSSSGVALSQRSVNRERAEVDVNASVSRPGGRSVCAEVVTTLLDAAGRVILRESRPVVWTGDTGTARIPLSVVAPHLWNGVRDPYLYSVNAELIMGTTVVDRVTHPLGLRFVRVDPRRGFYLNGEPYPLRGVSRHQDRAGKGWAVTEADELEDLAILRDLGANALRLAHYPHSSSFLDLCDRNGLLVWAEIPLVNKVRNTPGFQANAEQQLVEMIRQQRNHPSIVVWGLFNELYHQGPTDPCEELVARLHSRAKLEDPTRPTTAASNQPQRKELNAIPDLIACNVYPGWYGDGAPTQMREVLADWLAATDRRGLGVSEYGAGGSVAQHEEWPPRKPDPAGGWHPEEYQSFCHEQQYEQVQRNPAVWGSFVWNAFDFGSDARAEGDRSGINDKGLVSYDRQIRKDAFFFYKANWNPEPMVYLTSRRHTLRGTPSTVVRVYSNCDTVELRVGGRSSAVSVPNAMKVAVWPPVQLLEGDNRIQVVGRRGSLEVRDECVWQWFPARQPATPADANQSAMVPRQ